MAKAKKTDSVKVFRRTPKKTGREFILRKNQARLNLLSFIKKLIEDREDKYYKIKLKYEVS
jgi:hypothetical protein